MFHVVENGGSHAVGPPICIFVNVTSEKWNKWDDSEWNQKKYVSNVAMTCFIGLMNIAVFYLSVSSLEK